MGQPTLGGKGLLKAFKCFSLLTPSNAKMGTRQCRVLDKSIISWCPLCLGGEG